MTRSRLPSVASMILLVVIVIATFQCLSVQADTVPTLPYYNSQPANSNSNNHINHNNHNGVGGGPAAPAVGTVPPQASRRSSNRRTAATSGSAGAGAGGSSSSFSFDDIYKSTREEVLATREARKIRLVQMIGDMEQQLQDHAQGHRRLNEYEKNAVERRRLVYNRKLDTMLGELDIREVDRILAREEIRAEMVVNRMEKRYHDEL